MTVPFRKEIVKQFREDKTLVNGMLFSVFAFIGKGISFLLLIIIASFISPDDYGRLSLFNTIVMLTGFLMAFSTSGYLSISYFKADENTFRHDFSAIFLLLIISAFLITTVFFAFKEYISMISGLDIGVLSRALILAFFLVPCQMHMDYYRVQEKIKMYGVLNLGNAILNAVFSILLVVVCMQGWIGRVNTQLGVSVFWGLISIVYFMHRGFFTYHLQKDRLKMILFWGIPQIPHLATNWLRQGCDQYIINYHYSAQEVGLFSFALNIASIVTIIGMAFNASNSVAIFKILSDESLNNKEDMLKRNSRNIFVAYLAVTFITILLGCLFVYFVLPRYVECIPYFIILSLYGLLVCIYFLFCNYLFFYNHTKKLMFITFSSAIIHLCMSLLFTPVSLCFTVVIYVVSQLLCTILVYRHAKVLLTINLSN